MNDFSRSAAFFFCAITVLMTVHVDVFAQSRPARTGRVPIVLEKPGDPYMPRGTVAPLDVSVTPRAPAGSVQVNVDSMGLNIPGDAANEPSIAVDPTNPNKMAIGWRQFDTIASNFRQAGRAYTTNGGSSWTFPGVFTPGTFRSDPILRSDGQGRFFYNSLQGNFCMDIFRSVDGGVTYPVMVPALGGDKAWMEIDRRTSGIGAGNIYSAWSFGAPCDDDVGLFTRSTDGGLTWMTPIDTPVPSVFGTLAVGPDGEVYVGGIDFPSFSNPDFVVAKSSDARNPNVIPTWDFAVVGNFLGGSLQGGGAPNPDGLLGQAWIGVNHAAGPRRGHVYLLSSVRPAGGDPLDVMFSRSTDGGQNWSTPVRVNDDSTTNGAWQWFATMGVAPNGRIDVIWNDTRDNPGGSNLSRVYYSYSTDEGATWTPNVAKTPQFNSTVGWPNQNKIGDYYDIYSDLTGAHVAYSATFNGEQDVYYMHIVVDDCDTDGVLDAQEILNGSPDCNSNGIPDECEPDCNSNGVADECDVTDLTSDDCNSNLVPDECEPDCNNNDIPDVCDVPPIGPGPDCDSNGVPDDCDPQDDCNTNNILDICDLASGSSPDCNTNGIPDECDVPPLGAGADCNTNGIPDECEPQTDCNGSTVADFCDVASGTSDDCDSNGAPDECQVDGVFTLLSADFEAGTIPAGWSATGLWHATTACPRPNTCNPTHWGYYGIDAACNFDTGARTLGSLTPPPIAIHPNTSSLTLTYCSAYLGDAGNSNVSFRDWAWVSVNGVEVDDVSLAGLQTDWEARTVNMVGYAGQTITIAWNFDSRNAISNTLLGWQVDQIVLQEVVTNFNDCNLNQTLDSCEIQQGTAGDCNNNNILDECEALPVICPCNTVLGDADGNSIVDGRDIDEFVACFLLGPTVVPACGCADMNRDGVLDQLDVDLLVNCLIGVFCP